MEWLWFFASLRGRIGRRPYWIFMLIVVAIGFFIIIAGVFAESFDSELYFGGFSLLAFWPLIAVHAKRWHDRNRSTWWFPVAVVIPIFQWWILIESAFLAGTPGDNRFGPPPTGALGTKDGSDRNEPALVILIIGLAVVLAIYPGYRIPAGAMMPTLLVGDFVVANRAAYGVPMPFTLREVIPFSHPRRGDVIIFRYPQDPSVEYIKRVVGVPGDRVGYRDKVLYINGEPMTQTEVGIYTGLGAGSRMTDAIEVTERLGGVEHAVLIDPLAPNFAPGCNVLWQGEITVPEGHFFVMGDNRDNSNDSRCWGIVPRGYVVGKASLVWMHWDRMIDGFPILYTRIGRSVQ